MKPTEKQIDQQIRQLHCPAGKELDKRIQILFDGASQNQMTRPAIDRMGWRIMMNSRIFKFAATILIIAAVLLGIGLFNLTGSKSNLVFADVIKPFYTARCISYELLLNGQEPAIQDWVMGSKIRRIAGNMPSVINIIDLDKLKVLTLEADSKKAYVMDLKGLPQMPQNYIAYLCTLFNSIQNDKSPFTIENLGEKTEDGRQLAGLVAKVPNAEVEIWVDASTQIPVQIEERSSNLKVRMRNLEFHNEIDDSLFSMDIPQGYTTTDMGQLDLQGGTEKDFIEGLRILASINEGNFPAHIDVASYVQNATNTGLALKRLNLSEKEETETGLKLVRHILFLRFFKGQGDWHWAGNGVKLGEADKPIFWYQPADSANFRVIFGDLSVQEVSADKLGDVTKSAQTTYQSVGYTITEDAGFTCTQKDTWYILPGGQIKAYAQIQLEKGPKDAPNVVIKLPYEVGSVKSVVMAGKNLSFKPLESGQYQIDFDQALLKEGQKDITVEWTMPMTTLAREGNQYRTRLCTLMPATKYSLMVVLDSNSGWVNSEDPSKQNFTPFFCNGPDPFTDMGTCGLTIKPK